MRRLLLAPILLAAASCGPDAASDGCKDKLLPGDLVITEVFADSKAPPGGSGTDEGKEWFEIYNASDRPLELKGLTITHSRPDDSKAKSHVMEAITVAPGQFLTLGNTTQELVAPYIDYGYSSDLGDFFNTDGGKLTLACKSTEIDHATYEAVKEGHSRQLSNAAPPDYTLNDDPNQWCQADDSEFEAGNFGTPGSDSDCQPVVIGQCSDAGVMRDVVTPMPGDLVITEVMPNPAAASDTVGEWFEVLATNDVDLNGVGLDRAGDTANPNVITNPQCVRLRAGQYGLFAKSTDMTMNGGLPAPILGTFTFSLVDGTTAAPADVRLMAGMTVIDAISWTSTRSGKSHQLSPGFLNATDNDVESNFCDGSTVFGGGDSGTPGAANVACPTTIQPGMCMEVSGPRAIVKPAAGQLVISEFLANPAGTGTDATQEWFEITNTGATSFDLNGLSLKSNATTVNTINSVDCKPVAAGGYALFAHLTDPLQNGGLPAVDATFTFAIAASGGSLNVLDGTTVLDSVTWTTPAIGEGIGRQLMPGMLTSTANDLPANFCNGTAAQKYGTADNYGTPKAANVCLP